MATAAARADEVNTIVQNRRIQAAIQEQMAVEADLARRDETLRQAEADRERRGNAAADAWTANNPVTMTVEYAGVRISIRLNHTEDVARDTGIEAMRKVARYISRQVKAGVVSAQKGLRFDTPKDHAWVSFLLNTDLVNAARFGLVTVTDLKGRRIKLPASPVTTVETEGVRDEWLSA